MERLTTDPDPDLAELFSVSRATVYRVLERARISP
jgi:DNA-binding LacI/PurR family transcriptional regulator